MTPTTPTPMQADDPFYYSKRVAEAMKAAPEFSLTLYRQFIALRTGELMSLRYPVDRAARRARKDAKPFHPLHQAAARRNHEAAATRLSMQEGK